MSQASVDQAGHHLEQTSTGIPNKKLFMWAFLASDCMFFGVLIANHLVYRQNPPLGTPDPRAIFDIELTSVSTFVLLMSSLMMALAVAAIEKNNLKSFRRCILATCFFGLIFLGGQVYEFIHFVNGNPEAGVPGLTLQSSLFGSTFYVLTGTHGIHVAIGIIWLMSLYFFSLTGKLTHHQAIDVESAGLYWHFVDIVWIVIFTVVYLLEYV
jgi:heme/copper-type cytochrome/quinol oxidase subunit 3